MAGSSAGSVFVDLLLKDVQFRDGLSRSQRQAKNSFGSIKKDGTDSAKAIQAAYLGITGVIGALGAGAVFARFIANTKAAEQEQAQLAAVLRSTGNAAGYSIQQLNAMSDSLSRNSVFSGGEITNAQTRLLSYSGILSENIPRAMQIVIDQSARLGISLENSAETIGRALESPTKAAAALSRQGFGAAFTKEVQDMIKALEQQGRVAEAQAVVINILEESYEGAAKAARDTLGGSLANLSNRFNDLLTGTGNMPAVTGAINLLADNMGNLAKVAVAAGVAYTASFIPAVISGTTAIISGITQFIAYQKALAAVNILNGLGAASFSTLGFAASSALGMLTKGLAIIGGPVGVAFITLMYQIATSSNVAKDAQEALAREVAQFPQIITEYSKASAENRNNIRNDVKARIDAYRQEVLALAEIEKALSSENLIFRQARRAGSFLGYDSDAEDVKKLADQARIAADELEKISKGFDDVDNRKPAGEYQDPKAQEKAVKELNSLYNQHRGLIQGVDSATLKYRDTIEDLNKLLETGKITQEEYNGAIYRAQEEFDKARDKGTQFAFDVEAATKRAAENIQDSFADFLFDPFDKGLKGMLKGFVDTIRRMIAEAQSAQILGALFGNNSNSGLGQLLGSLTGSAGSNGIKYDQPFSFGSFGGIFDGFFADGGYISPGHFGVAGEAGAELIYGGKTGATVFNQDQVGRGNVYNIDARGADQAAVTRLEQSLLTLAGPGVIEQRVGNAQIRGAL